MISRESGDAPFEFSRAMELGADALWLYLFCIVFELMIGKVPV